MRQFNRIDNPTRQKRIISVRIVKEADDCPDTSTLGEYTDNLGEGVIVRALDEFYERLDDDEMEQIPDRGRECRGFMPYASGEKQGTAEFYVYGKRDYERMESLNKGDWYYLGIMAVAAVDLGSGIIQEISSGGLWGIESDSDPSYFKEVTKEELGSLARELRAMGFSAREVTLAIAQREED